MELTFSFAPDAARARDLDAHMRLELVTSIKYLIEAVVDQLDVNPKDIGVLIEALEQGTTFPPSTFGLYYEITVALMNEDYQLATALLKELVKEQTVAADSLKIVTLDKVKPMSRMMRYQRLMDTDAATPFYIIPPPANDAEKLTERFKSTFKRLQQTIPALAAEFESLIREVILVTGDKRNGYDFTGGASSLLWGALFINAGRYTTDVAMIEAIAHESAHSLLFGFAIDEALVENAAEERYASPLRDDLRPMDGIFHATFVLARMHWAMSKLLESSQLSADEIKLATAARETDYKNFWNGYATVRDFAKLSPTGSKLMNSAFHYMSQFQAI